MPQHARWVGSGLTRRFGVLAVVAGLLLGLAAVTPAHALDVRTSQTTRVLGDVSVQRLTITLDDGRTVRGDALRFRANDPAVELRPRLARGTAVGLLRMSSLALAERARGAVAGVNGGYWLSRPTGVPNGLYVERGRLVAGDSALRSGLPAGRAVAGIRPDGSLVMDRLRVRLRLDVPFDVEPLRIDEINRQVRTPTDGTLPVTGELLLFDRTYGTSFQVPADSVLLVVDEVALGTSGRVVTTIRERRTPTTASTWTVPEGTSAVLAYGTRAPELAGLTVGMQVGVQVQVEPYGTDPAAWSDLRGALPGGGLLVRGGRISSGTELASEGLDHASRRRARTAIGWTASGHVLLVTLDETGGSAGATLFETARIMAALGATDAVALDGGGSTAMTIDGQLRNRPSDPDRGHSQGLFLYVTPPGAARGLDGACPPGTAPSGTFSDTTATVHAEAIDCLAWWGVTSGVTLASYAPADGVTRAQMASFLVRWIDDTAARGDGQPLPTSAALTFEDVPAHDVHANSIARLNAVGIVQGRAATIYDPAAPVTRGETASLLQRTLEHITGTPLAAGRDTFVDDTGSVHEASIDQLAALGVITGTGGFSFRPNDTVSRGAMASLLMRASDHLVELGRTTPPA